MSLSRIHRIVSSGVLPFNFGMDCAEWRTVYETTPSMRAGIGDPDKWTPEECARIDREAAEENALFDRLMALPDAEFADEVERLARELPQ